MGLLFREHPKAQPEGGFRRSPGSNLRPLVYKASDLTTAPRRLKYFLFLLQNIHCGYSLSRTIPTIYVLSKNIKNINSFLMKFSILQLKKNLCILHGHFFSY